MRRSEAIRPGSPARFLILAALLLTPACASAPQAPAESAAPAPAKLERDLLTARDKLSIAKLQLDLAGKRAESSRMRKEKELEFARAELIEFDENDAPNRLAKSKLGLTRLRDALAEQQEELAQLEMLYEKQDLADKTREIVLQRGKRRVERAQDEVAIAERESATLETKALPRQRAKLALEIEAKTRELAEQKSEAEAALLEKRLAVRSSEADVQVAEEKAAAAGSKP